MRSFRIYLFYFVSFACVGITTEIFFTALSDFYPMIQTGILSWKLQGKSYMWMFPIYGLSGILAPLIVHRFAGIFILLRLTLYAIAIMTVEFVAGFFLEQITGTCPWNYTTGIHFMGYVRLDYFPAWAFFAFCIERLFLLLEGMVNGKGL